MLRWGLVSHKIFLVRAKERVNPQSNFRCFVLRACCSGDNGNHVRKDRIGPSLRVTAVFA